MKQTSKENLYHDETTIRDKLYHDETNKKEKFYHDKTNNGTNFYPDEQTIRDMLHHEEINKWGKIVPGSPVLPGPVHFLRVKRHRVPLLAHMDRDVDLRYRDGRCWISGQFSCPPCTAFFSIHECLQSHLRTFVLS